MTKQDAHNRPLIWVLKGLRQGDTAQAMALALQIGGRVEGKQLSFNRLHALPNWLAGAGIGHVTPDSRGVLRPPWPDAVVSTGRRTARAALWIKQQSEGRTKLVQIGRPRVALGLFDLVVTTPQYGLPPSDNVIEIPLPFAIPRTVDDDTLRQAALLWSRLPRPWLLGVIGGGKYPLHLTQSDLADYGKQLSAKAKSLGGGVILLDSPRTPKGALKVVAENTTVPHWFGERGHGMNPYQAALKLCDQLAVTSDSVSMISEMLLSEKPVWIYRLKKSPLALGWSGKSGIAAALAKRGILHPPRDVDNFIRRLMEKNLVADLQSLQIPAGSAKTSADHAQVVERIKRLLWVLPTSETASSG